jgi:hypothetical protein
VHMEREKGAGQVADKLLFYAQNKSASALGGCCDDAQNDAGSFVSCGHPLAASTLPIAASEVFCTRFRLMPLSAQFRSHFFCYENYELLLAYESKRRFNAVFAAPARPLA